MSIIGYPPPSAVKVGGGEIPINTSHHCGVRVASIIEDPTIPDIVAVYAVLKNYFPAFSNNEIEKNKDALWDAAMWFFFCGNYEPPPPPKPGAKPKKPPEKKRIWDWEYDADTLIRDFQDIYTLDITDPDTSLHWWRFMVLFNGLGDTSVTMHVKSIRARSLSDCKTPEERELLRQQKKAVALPPRTASEVELEI